MKLSQIDITTVKCEQCQGKPDTLYFKSDDDKGTDGEILSIICDVCKSSIESMIKGMGRSFCIVPDCEDCAKMA